MKPYALLLACTPAFADVPKEEWVWQSLHALDTAQTIHIAQHPDRWYETNPLLGKHPSTEKVIVWGVGMSVLHYAVAYQIEKHGYSARPFEYLTIGLTGGVVFLNWKRGIGP